MFHQNYPQLKLDLKLSHLYNPIQIKSSKIMEFILCKSSNSLNIYLSLLLAYNGFIRYQVLNCSAGHPSSIYMVLSICQPRQEAVFQTDHIQTEDRFPQNVQTPEPD